MVIKEEKKNALKKRMLQLGIIEKDLIEKFILGSGSGGQKINKTHSCVYLKHIPTGFEIKCQRDRSRESNRYLARVKLCQKIEETVLKQKSEKHKKNEKIRRQKKRRTRRQKEKMLKDKKKLSQKKQLRKPPTID